MRNEIVQKTNDRFRRTLVGGRVVITPDVEALGEELVSVVLGDVQLYSRFTPLDDLYSEHDFGRLEVNGKQFFWRIDLDNFSSLENPREMVKFKTGNRVLTITSAEEVLSASE